MNDAAQRGEGLIKRKMGLGIGRGIEVSFNPVSIEIQHNQIVGGQLLVFDAGRLDDDQSLFPVNTCLLYTSRPRCPAPAYQPL